MKEKNAADKIRPYEGTGLPHSEEELFHLEPYALIDKNVVLEISGEENDYPEIIHMLHSQLLEAEKEFMSAHEKRDWKKMQFLADRQRDGALYSGATRLRYACQFLECYFETNQATLLEALYEQTINVIEQTKKATENQLDSFLSLDS